MYTFHIISKFIVHNCVSHLDLLYTFMYDTWIYCTCLCVTLGFIYTLTCDKLINVLYIHVTPGFIIVPTCVYPDVVFVVGGASKGSSTPLLITDIGTFTSVSPDVDFSDVRGCEGSLTSLKGALKGTLPYRVS